MIIEKLNLIDKKLKKKKKMKKLHKELSSLKNKISLNN